MSSNLKEIKKYNIHVFCVILCRSGVSPIAKHMFNSNFYLSDDDYTSTKRAYDNIRECEYDAEPDVYEDAIILPRVDRHLGGVCDSSFRFLAGYERYDYPNTKNNWLDITESYHPDEVLKSDETVIFAGMMIGHFGHLITDCVTRLWYVIKNPDIKHRIAYMFVGDTATEMQPYHYEFLSLLGIGRDRILLVETPTQFKKVIVPKQSCHWCSSYHKDLFYIVYDEITRKITPKKDRKLYLSKSKYKDSNRLIFNEGYFEDFFEKRGFKVIYPEDLPVSEQVAYAAGAEEIACTAGTLPHFALFAKNGIKLICLVKTTYSFYLPDYIQHVANAAKKVDFVFVDVSLNFVPATHHSQMSLIGPTVYWKRFIRDEYGIESNEDVFDYLDKTNINLGSFLRLYLNEVSGNSNILYFNYLKSMFQSFDPEGYRQLLVNGAQEYRFRNRTFRRVSAKGGSPTILRLCDDGNIQVIGGPEVKGKYWTCLSERLYFLDECHQPVSEFFFERMYAGRLSLNKAYMGYMCSDRKDTVRLFEINHRILKAIIKILVGRERYRKLKSDPQSFFADSRSKVIRFLGRYYI